MAAHIYDNPGAKNTTTQTSIEGVIGLPATTHVTFADGADRLELIFTDLDTLDEAVHLLEEARASHIVALCDGRSEMVCVDRLESDDLAVIDAELVMVESTVIDGEHLIVRYGKKYAGTYDMTAGRSIRCLRTTRVKRLLADVSLAVVR